MRTLEGCWDRYCSLDKDASGVLGSELCLKLRFPFFDDSLFDPEPTIFFNNFGNHQNRIWKKPCKFEQEML